VNKIKINEWRIKMKKETYAEKIARLTKTYDPAPKEDQIEEIEAENN